MRIRKITLIVISLVFFWAMSLQASAAETLPSTETEALFLNRSVRLPLTTFQVGPAHKNIALPRTLPTPIPFTLTTRRGLLSEFEISELYTQDLMATVELSGPGYSKPAMLAAIVPNSFSIPTLPIDGTYHLTNLRIYRGEVLVALSADTITIEVFDKILVTEVNTRVLTLDEIKDRGIVIDPSSFSTMDFTAALVFSSQTVAFDMLPISGPISLPLLVEDDPLVTPSPTPPSPPPPTPIPPPQPTEMPNIFVAPIPFNVVVDKDEAPPPLPPISGLIIIPGQIGFLHQFFEAQLLVLQNAPKGSSLIVRDLVAKIVLPTGLDHEAGTERSSGDDPMRIARQEKTVSSPILPVLRLSDRVNALGPQDGGDARFLLEGLLEGTHDFSFEITGMLDGLPGGPVAIAGIAHGTILVRDPTFTITLSHPATIRSGEDYNLYAIVTNTGKDPANLVSVRLNRNAVSGATLLSAESQSVDTILPGSSATMAFRLRSKVTGKVTATTFPADKGVTGRFALRTGVGDLGIPLSPDTLILPSYAYQLPSSLLDPAIGLLGLAYSVATALAGALPPGMSRISKKVVEEKARVLAEAGLWIILGMSPADAIADLLPQLTKGPAGYETLVAKSKNGVALTDAITAIVSNVSPPSGPRLIAATVPDPELIAYPDSRWGCAMGILHKAGTYLFLLASEALDNDATVNLSHHSVEGQSPVMATIDGTGRLVILQLARPVGPFIQREIVVSDMKTRSGQIIPETRLTIVSHLQEEGANVVSGQLLRAGGAVTNGAVAMTFGHDCNESYPSLAGSGGVPNPLLIGIAETSARGATSSLNASYQFDYVLAPSVLIHGKDIASGESESLSPPFRFAGESVSLDLILRASGTVSIQLLDPSGQPARSADVLITGAASFVSGQSVSAVSLLKRTDEQGTVGFEKLPVGPYQIQARHGDQIAATAVALTRAGDSVSITLKLIERPGLQVGSVRVRVIAPDGISPISGAWVQLLAGGALLTQGEGYQVAAYTDQTGTSIFTEIPSGESTIKLIDPASGETREFPLSVLPNKTTQGTFVLRGVGSVEGRVINTGGQPVAGVLVIASGISQQARWAFTNEAGKFAISGVSLGNVSLVAIESIRGRIASSSITIRDQGDIAQVDLTLSSRASIVGTVTDHNGRPVADAEARIITRDMGCPGPSADVTKGLADGSAASAIGQAARTDQGAELSDALNRFKEAVEAALAAKAKCADMASEDPISYIYTKTDSNGNYRFSDLDMTDFKSGTIIVVKGSDVANAGFKLTRDGEVKRVDLKFIERTGAIAGQVLDRASKDLPVGARVVLYGVEPNAAGLLVEGRVIAWIDTDPQTGRFAFLGLYPGPFRLTATNPFHPDEVNVNGILLASEQKKLNLVFEKQLAGITGRVIGLDKKTPVVGVLVKTALAGAPIEVITDAHGIYNIPKVLPEGYYQIAVDDPETGAKSEIVTVMVSAGQEVEQSLWVLGKGAIEVRLITSNGQPVEKAVVKVTRTGSPVDQAEETATGGVIQFNALLEGKYAVEVFDLILGRGARGEVVIPANQKTGYISLVLSETGLITGTFLAVDKTTPISPARLSLFRGEKHIGVATTASDGTFEFEHVPMGEMRVVGYNPATGRRVEGKGTLSIDGQEIPLVLVEEGLGRVVGRVLAADKITAVSGVILRLTSLSPLGTIYGVSGADGSFLFEGIPVGFVSLTVEDRRTQQASLGKGAIQKEGDEVALFLIQEGSGEIGGQVIFADGTPAPFVAVNIGQHVYTQSDEAGQFTLPPQPIGPVQILAKEQNGPRSGTGFATITQLGEKLSVLIKLSGIGTLIVHALDGGKPMEGAKITVVPTDAIFLTGPNGEAQFERLPQGNYTVTAMSQDQRRSVTMSARIVFDQQDVYTRMELGHVGSIRVSVNRGDEIKPAAGAVGTLIGEKIFLTRSVDEEGMLRFDQVPIGTYTLSIDEAGTGAGSVQGVAHVVLTVQENEEVDLGLIVLDSEAIRVVSLSPADGELNVSLDQAMSVRFSEPLNFSSLTASTFQVIEQGASIDGLFSFDPSQNMLTFSPKTPLKSSTSYRIKIADITDKAGHSLFPSVDTTFQTADRIPPKVVSIYPADGMIEVAPESVIRIVFTEGVTTPAGIQLPLVAVKTSSGGKSYSVPVRLHFAEENRVLIVEPTEYLQINRTYEVHVEGITDISGNPMRKAVRVRFSTKDTIPPTIDFFAFAHGTIKTAGQPARVIVNASDVDLARIEIALDGSVIGFAEQGTLAFTIPLSISDQAVLTAVAIDKAGNRSIASRLLVNSQDGPPLVSIVSSTVPGPGEAFQIILKAEDDDHLTTFSYSATGAVIQSESRTASEWQDQWEVHLAIPETAEVGSTLTLSATAVDNVGYSTVITRLFRLRDNQPPAVEIIGPEQLFFGQNGEIKIKASDQHTTLSSISLEIEGAVNMSGSYSLVGDKQDEEISVPLDIPQTSDDKTVTITAIAVDQFGNRGEAKSVTINLVGGTVMGAVFERTVPIANVTVWADIGSTRKMVRTDSTGHFLFTGLFPGKIKIIAADSGRSLRSGGEVEILDHGTIAHLDLILQAGGSLIGHLITASGQPVGRYITVQAQTGGISLQTLTDDTGSFQFDPLPMTTVSLSATDLDGNYAEGSVRVVGADQAVALWFYTRGDVSGKVVFGGGEPVAYAEVTLNPARGERRTMIANQEGEFSFDKIFSGAFTLTATDPVMHLNGTVYSELPGTYGAKKEITITLTPLGDVKGVVYSAVDHKPVIGVKVDIWNGWDGLGSASTQTDKDGRFHFRNVPIHSYYPTYQLSAVSSDGDYSEASVTLKQHGDEVVQEMIMVGFGEAVVIVTNSSGVPIVGADVSISGRVSMSSVTDDRGVVSFQALTAGKYTVQAKFNTSYYWTVYVPVTVEVGKKTPVNIVLAGGTIQGRVLAADHLTPVADLEVFCGCGDRTGLTDHQGRFSFSSVEIGAYYLQVRVNGRLRAQQYISLNKDGEVKTEEIVMTPVGTVTGTIYDPSGAPLAWSGMVQLHFMDPLNGNTMTVYSQADGSYQAEQAPLGHIRVAVSDFRNDTDRADAEGDLTADGQTLVINLHLADNAVLLPTDLYMLGSQYYLSQDGSYTLNGHPSRRCDACNQLTLIVNGQVASFPNSHLGRVEDDRREIGITREGLGGVVVTRKLFVPKRGYATRSLELLTNPTDEPIKATIKLSLLSSSNNKLSSIAPSIQSDTGWVILSGKEKEASTVIAGDGKIYQQDRIGDEAYVAVFGQSVRRGKLFQQYAEPRKAGDRYQDTWKTEITYGMEEIVIASGETVGFLHFDSLVWDKEGEQATVDRLKGLPPEMLEGLSDAEQASIINFDLKQDRNLTLAAPKTISKVSIRVFQKVDDQLIPMPNTRIDFKSTDPIFPITHNGVTDGEGSLVVDYQNEGETVPFLPRGPIDIQAFAQVERFDPITDEMTALSLQTTVVDSEGDLSADLILTKTGAVSLSFARPGGMDNVAHLAFTHQESKKNYTVDNIYSPTDSAMVLALPPGPYHAVLTIDHPQGYSPLSGSASFSVFASQKTNVEIPIESTGHLEGNVRTRSDQQVGNLYLEVVYPQGAYPSCENAPNSCASRTYNTYSDASGRYQFIHLPAGHAQLTTTMYDTGIQSKIDVNIVAGTTVHHDIVLVSASVRLHVKALFPNGQPAANAVVELVGIEKGVADKDGIARFTVSTAKPYMLRVFRPEAGFLGLFTEKPFRFNGEGDITGTVEAVVMLSLIADLNVIVTHCGVPLSGSLISIEKAGSSAGHVAPSKTSRYTNGEGRVVFNALTDGAYIVNVVSLNGALVPVSITPFDDGHVKSIEIRFCDVYLSGQVVAADGKTAVSNATVFFKDAGGNLLDQVKTDDDGHFNTKYKFPNGMDVTIEAMAMAVRVVQTVMIDSEKGERIILPPFVLPLSIVTGNIRRMYRGSIETVTDATLFGVYNQAGRVRSDAPHVYKEGKYLFLGLPVGDFEMTVHTSNNGQTAISKWSIEAIEQAVEINVVLPPVNDLRILLKDADGNPLKKGIGSVAVDRINSPFTMQRNFGGWGLINGQWTNTGGGVVWNGEDGVLVLERVPAGVGLVVAAKNNEVISSTQFIALPETDSLLTVTLSFPKMVSVVGQAVASDGVTPLTNGTESWQGTVPTPFGFGGESYGWKDGKFEFNLPAGPIRLEVNDFSRYGYRLIEIVGGEDLTLVAGKQTQGNALFGYLFSENETNEAPGGPSKLLMAGLSLTIGQRSLGWRWETYWTEGEAVLFPPISVGSLLVSRRFINMPGRTEDSRAVLSIDQISNPYPEQIEVETGIDLRGYGGDYKLRYSHSSGSILKYYRSGGSSCWSWEEGACYILFGSSMRNQGQRVVVPAMSCRTVVHLWDAFDQWWQEDDVVSNGIDLLDRFAVLDFKSIIAEGKSCPLAE